MINISTFLLYIVEKGDKHMYGFCPWISLLYKSCLSLVPGLFKPHMKCGVPNHFSQQKAVTRLIFNQQCYVGFVTEATLRIQQSHFPILL